MTIRLYFLGMSAAISAAAQVGQFAGIMPVLLVGFGPPYTYLCTQDQAHLLRWLGFDVAIVVTSTFTILQAVDGFAQVHSGIPDSSSRRGKINLIQGCRGGQVTNMAKVTFLAFSKATLKYSFVLRLKSMFISMWAGVPGAAAFGAITIAAGIEVFYAGFAYAKIATGPLGISMMIFINRVEPLDGLVWKRAMPKSVKR
jgi:hypothetical protein